MCEPAGPQEVADELGVSRNRVYQLRGRMDFPMPKWWLATGPLWELDDIRNFKLIPRANGRPATRPEDEPVPHPVPA